MLSDFAKTVAIFVLLSHVVTTMARLRLAAWLLTWMAIGLGLFALYNFMTGAMIDQGANQDRLVGNEGALTKNPNDLALMVNLLLPLTVGIVSCLQRDLAADGPLDGSQRGSRNGCAHVFPRRGSHARRDCAGVSLETPPTAGTFLYLCRAARRCSWPCHCCRLPISTG